MKLVVDSNIVFSAILNSQSRIGQILLLSEKSLQFYSPQFLKVEIQNHLPKIKKLSHLSDSELWELNEILYTKIHFIADELIPQNSLLIADELTRDIDFDDTMFVALSLHLNCKLWTGDKALVDALTKKGFKKFINTQELINRLKKKRNF